MRIFEHPEVGKSRPKEVGSDNAARNDTAVWTHHAALKVTITAVASFLVVWWWLAAVLQFQFMQGDVPAIGKIAWLGGHRSTPITCPAIHC